MNVKYVVVIVFLLVALNGWAQQTKEPPWETVELNRTTEERLLFLFGIPDYVRIDMMWPEYLRFQQSPAVIRALLFCLCADSSERRGSKWPARPSFVQ